MSGGRVIDGRVWEAYGRGSREAGKEQDGGEGEVELHVGIASVRALVERRGGSRGGEVYIGQEGGRG